MITCRGTCVNQISLENQAKTHYQDLDNYFRSF